MKQSTQPESIVSAITSCHLFSGVSTEVASAIAQLATRHRYEKGDFIIRRVDPPHHVYVIRSGLAKLMDCTAEGDQLILGWLRPGDTCGLGALISGNTNTLLNVEAVKKCEVLVWSAAEMQGLIKQYPIIGNNALAILLSLMAMSLERLGMMISTPVAQRLARILDDSKMQIGTSTIEGTEIVLTDEDLAELAGTTLYSVSRLLQTWSQRGLLQKSRGRVVIPAGLSIRAFLTASHNAHTE